MQTREITLGARTISVTEAGDGAPIVLLHAFPLSARMWHAQLARLPPGWRAIAPDFRGLGRSPRGEAPARHVGDHAADVLGLVDALGLPPAVVAGVSMGGYVAFEIWRQRPESVRALVLADTRAEADTDEARGKRVAMQERALREGTAAVIDAMLPGLLGETTQVGDPHLAREVRDWALESEPAGVADALEALKTRPDSRATLGTITCPTLVVVGEEDTLTPPAAARVIADGIAGARYAPIARAGHLANVEQPEAFDAVLRPWLAALARAAALPEE